MRMCVWTCGSLDTPLSGFVKTADTRKRHGASTEHAEEQWVEWTQISRLVGVRDGGVWIAILRVDECKRVMTQGEVRAQVDGLLQFDNGPVMAAAQPKGSAYSPARRGHDRRP
jgi:hypothetical protein